MTFVGCRRSGGINTLGHIGFCSELEPFTDGSRALILLWKFWDEKADFSSLCSSSAELTSVVRGKGKVVTCVWGVLGGRRSWYSADQTMEQDLVGSSAGCCCSGSAKTNLLWKHKHSLFSLGHEASDYIPINNITINADEFYCLALKWTLGQNPHFLPSCCITGSWCYEIRDPLKDLYSPRRVWTWFSGESST